MRTNTCHVAYSMPNDEAEMDRLDLLHEIVTRANGRQLFLAPFEPSKIRRALDMGTGTGICEFLTLFDHE